MTNRIVVCALLLVAATVTSAVHAQGDPTRPGRRPLAQGRGQPDSMARNRAALEGQVRDRLSQVARRQLGLNDAQAEKLQQTTMKFADRRRMLMEQERDVRMSLREEMITGDSTRGRQVGDLMDRMVKTQRQRIDVLEEEQKELAGYLTPMQRARFFGLEEQLRQRVQQMRGDGEGAGMGPQGGPGGPGGLGGRGRMGGRGRPNGPPPDGMGGPPPGQVRRPPPDVPPAM